jgi:hypothetical protein
VSYRCPAAAAAAAIAHLSLDLVLFIDRMYKISTLRSLYEAEIETVPTHGLEDAARIAQGRTPAKDSTEITDTIMHP